MRRDRHREAWTAFVEGREAKPMPKYGNVREGHYASKKEASVAAQLAALQACGKIVELKEQVPFILIPKDGKLRAIKYVADFTFHDEAGFHVLDVKGGQATKTPTYRLKKRLMHHILGIDVVEV